MLAIYKPISPDLENEENELEYTRATSPLCFHTKPQIKALDTA